jgi:hypothetical protein
MDVNEDATIDRWEYYSADRQLRRIGTSRQNDDKEDSWLQVGPDGAIVRRDVSSKRDGKIARTEYFDRGLVAAAEEDSDGDGHFDKWEQYDAGRLAVVAFDPSHDGAPDRQLVYDHDGSMHVEIIDEAGRFVVAQPRSVLPPTSR